MRSEVAAMSASSNPFAGIGKVAGMVVVMGTILLAGPLLLAAFRIGMAGDTKTMIDLLPWLGRALTVGLLASLAYATLPLALSALVGKRTISLAVWAAYYVMGTSLLSVVGMLTWRPLAAIDPANAVVSRMRRSRRRTGRAPRPPGSRPCARGGRRRSAGHCPRAARPSTG